MCHLDVRLPGGVELMCCVMVVDQQRDAGEGRGLPSRAVGWTDLNCVACGCPVLLLRPVVLPGTPVVGLSVAEEGVQS